MKKNDEVREQRRKAMVGELDEVHVTSTDKKKPCNNRLVLVLSHSSASMNFLLIAS